MHTDFINLTAENLSAEHLCCIIRNKPHPGVEAKRQWLCARIVEGHIFRKLDAKDTVFIEYAPLGRKSREWPTRCGERRMPVYYQHNQSEAVEGNDG